MNTGHPPFDWAINAIERKADEANRRLHELDSLRSDVGSLECANREIRSEVDGLRSAIEAALRRIETLEQHSFAEGLTP